MAKKIRFAQIDFTGTSTQFVKADGSFDSNTYTTQSWVTSQNYITAASIPTNYTPLDKDNSYNGANFNFDEEIDSLTAGELEIETTGYWYGLPANYWGTVGSHPDMHAGFTISHKTIYPNNWLQYHFDYQGNIFSRGYDGYGLKPWKKFWHEGNFNPNTKANVSDFNNLPNVYVPINGPSTINGTKTFTESLIVPTPTLAAHAVNRSWVTSQGYITNAALNGYATQSWVSAEYQPLNGVLTKFGTDLIGSAPVSTGLVRKIAGPPGSPWFALDTNTYLTQADLAGYVTTNTPQTITGDKTFQGALKTEMGQIYFYDSSADSWGTIQLADDVWSFNNGVNNFATLSLGGNLTLYKTNSVGAIISPQTLTAPRSYNLPNASGTIALQEWVTSQGYITNDWGNHRENGVNNWLGADYISGGNEKPNSIYFGAGKLKLQMLNGSNVGAPDLWNDVLWMSSYTGGDVKKSTAIVSSKYTNKIGFVKQDFDAVNWGTYVEFWTTDNLPTPANLSTMQLDVSSEVEGGQSIKINGSNQTPQILTNYFVTSRDGSRDPNTNVLPNGNSRRVRFDFIAAGYVGGTGNYGGVMTYSPWDGTSASTGDSSYQLAFLNQTGVSGSGVPMLKLRKGIDGAWSNTWYKIYTEADFNPASFITSSSLNTTLNNYVTTNGSQSITATKTFTVSPIVPNPTLAGHAVNKQYLENQLYGTIRLNQPSSWDTWDDNIGAVSDYVGGEVGIMNFTTEDSVAIYAYNDDYFKYGSNVGVYDGLNIKVGNYPNLQNKIVTIGQEVKNTEDKVQIDGNVSVNVSDVQLILNPIINNNGDLTEYRNAHIYYFGRTDVHLPNSPIEGQRFELHNVDGSDRTVYYNNTPLFVIGPERKHTGVYIGSFGFVFDTNGVPFNVY